MLTVLLDLFSKKSFIILFSDGNSETKIDFGIKMDFE